MSSRRRNEIQRIKTQELTHVTRVKQALEHVAKSDKPIGNAKRMNVRTSMDSYGSGARTQAQAPPTCTQLIQERGAMGQR